MSAPEGGLALLVGEAKGKGNAAFAKSAFREAVAHYDAALQHTGAVEAQGDAGVKGTLGVVASNKAECLLKLEEWDAAQQACDVSLSLQPGAWKALWRRGRALEGSNRSSDFAGAVSSYQEALEALSSGGTPASEGTAEAIRARISRLEAALAAAVPPQRFQSHCASRILEKGEEGDCVQQLMTRGYAVIDSYFHLASAAQLLEEVKGLIHTKEPQSFLTPNRTFFKDPEGNITPFDKPHVFEVDLHSVYNDAMRKAEGPVLEQRYEKLYSLFSDTDIPDALEEAGGGELLLDKGEGRYAIKLQWNEGGGSFPWHIDNPGNNKRRVTTVVYLNSNWKEGDGGEVVLLPFMGDQVVVAPKFNRCVMFLSESMNHKVLPAVAERYCFSVWYDRHPASPQNFDMMHATPLPLLPTPVPPKLAFLQKPSIQRTLSRLVYEEEYIESLDACMPQKEASPAYVGLLTMHRTHVDGIRKANSQSGLLDTVDMLRSLKAQGKTVKIV